MFTGFLWILLLVNAVTIPHSVLFFVCVLKQVEKTIGSHLSVIIKTCN